MLSLIRIISDFSRGKANKIVKCVSPVGIGDQDASPAVPQIRRQEVVRAGVRTNHFNVDNTTGDDTLGAAQPSNTLRNRPHKQLAQYSIEVETKLRNLEQS
jgi:hypothetical protein